MYPISRAPNLNQSQRSESNLESDKAKESQDSRDFLTGYKAHLTTPGGSVKAGVLHIRTANGQDQLVRDRAYHLRSRKGAHFGEAASFLKEKFATAYEGKVSPQKYKALTDALDKYLTNRNQQLGTKTFVNLVNAFEIATLEHSTLKAAGGKAFDAETSVMLAGSNADQAFDGVKASVQVRIREQAEGSGEIQILPRIRSNVHAENKRQGLIKAFDLKPDDVKPLEPGAASDAYMFKGEVVTSPRSFRELTVLNEKTLKRGEFAVAMVDTEMPHVAKPKAFILRVKQYVDSQISHRGGDGKAVRVSGPDSQAFEVPASKLKEFLKAQPSGAVVEQLAVKMPAGAAKNIREVFKENPLSETEFRQVASGLYDALGEMHQAGLLHHDIKPANATFDRETGAVMLVDLGSTVALNENQKTTDYSPGSALFSPPMLQQGASTDLSGSKHTLVHGVETDRYGFAITLMNALAPSLEIVHSKNSFATENAFGTALNGIATAPDDGDSAVEIYLEALRELAAKEPDPVSLDLNGKSEEEAAKAKVEAAPAKATLAELDESFKRIPDAKKILDTALRSGVEGGKGDVAWSKLKQLLPK